MTKISGFSQLVVGAFSCLVIASGVTVCSVYSLYRGAADEAAKLRADRDALTAQVGSYVLDTGHGEIVCKNGLKLGPKELKGSPLSPTEHEGLMAHIKNGRCAAFLLKNGRCAAFLQKNDGIN